MNECAGRELVPPTRLFGAFHPVYFVIQTDLKYTKIYPSGGIELGALVNNISNCSTEPLRIPKQKSKNSKLFNEMSKKSLSHQQLKVFIILVTQQIK